MLLTVQLCRIAIVGLAAIAAITASTEPQLPELLAVQHYIQVVVVEVVIAKVPFSGLFGSRK